MDTFQSQDYSAIFHHLNSGISITLMWEISEYKSTGLHDRSLFLVDS